ncbi:MAG: twin-arginine translocase TatA/TatE family subunit [Bacteroidota bacterium]
MLSSIYIFLNLGGGEVFLIVLVIILFFGSDKLPGIAKGLGKGLREINDAKNQIQSEISKSTGGITEEIKKHTTEIQSEIGKAGAGVKRQFDDASKTLSDEGKAITDTTKE